MKTAVAEFTLKVPVSPNTLTVKGKLVGVNAPEPKEAKSKLVSPDDAKEPVLQFYVPESLALQSSIPRDRMYTRGECDVANVVKDQVNGTVEVTALPKDAIEEAKKSALPKNIMTATVHSAEEADKMMFPMKDHQSYVFYPSAADPDYQYDYDLILGLVKRGFALCSIVNLNNFEGLYRLTVWRDRLVLVRQSFPEAINPHEAPENEPLVPDVVIDKMAKKVAKKVTPLDMDTYRDRIVAAKIAVKEAVAKGEEIPDTVEIAAPKMTRLEELMAFLEDDDDEEEI